jgi:DNA primase
LWLACCYNEDCLQVRGQARQLRDRVFCDILNGQQPDPVRPGRARSPRPMRVLPAGPVLLPLHRLDPAHPALVYLRQRGFDPIQLSRERYLAYCQECDPLFEMAKHRIIIPILMNQQLVGWQARFVGEPPDKTVPKYYSLPGMHKSELLCDYDCARSSPYVIVCQGATDVWSVGLDAVALLGKKASGAQVRLLRSTWGQGGVIILLDGDAQDEALELHDALGPVRKVIVPLPKNTDPGSLPTAPLRAHIAAESRRVGIEIR